MARHFVTFDTRHVREANPSPNIREQKEFVDWSQIDRYCEMITNGDGAVRTKGFGLLTQLLRQEEVSDTATSDFQQSTIVGAAGKAVRSGEAAETQAAVVCATVLITKVNVTVELEAEWVRLLSATIKNVSIGAGSQKKTEEEVGACGVLPTVEKVDTAAPNATLEAYIASLIVTSAVAAERHASKVKEFACGAAPLLEAMGNCTDTTATRTLLVALPVISLTEEIDDIVQQIESYLEADEPELVVAAVHAVGMMYERYGPESTFNQRTFKPFEVVSNKAVGKDNATDLKQGIRVITEFMDEEELPGYEFEVAIPGARATVTATIPGFLKVEMLKYLRYCFGLDLDRELTENRLIRTLLDQEKLPVATDPMWSGHVGEDKEEEMDRKKREKQKDRGIDRSRKEKQAQRGGAGDDE